MTGQPTASFPPSQPLSQRIACEVEQATGIRCPLPASGATGYRFCQRHDPQQAEQRRAQARQAAKASHATFRPDPELEAWADTLDWSTEEKREQALLEAAVLVAKGGLTPAQGNAIAALARAAAARPAKMVRPTPALVVEVQKFGHNGQEAGS